MAVELASAYVSILPTTKGIQGKLTEELGGQAGKAAKTAGGRAGGVLSGAMRQAMKLAPFVSVGAAIGFALTKGFGRLTAIENAQAKLKGLGHSAKSVDTIMDNALGAVKGTAFGLDEAATVAASSVAAGIRPGTDLRRVLGLVGDTASIAGSSMGEMGAIFNKVAASNRLSLGEVNQLADRGVPILGMLAKQFNVTQGEMAKMVSAGEVDFPAFAKALETNIGGAALESGDTTQGAFANMKAAAGRFGASLLQGVFPITKKVFGGVTTLLDNATGKMKPFVDAFSGWIVTKVVPAAESLLGKVGQLGGKVKAFFDSAAGQQLKTDTMEKLSSIFSKIGDAAKNLGPAVSSIASSLGQASGAIGISTWQLLLTTVDALASVANTVLVPVIKALADWMSKHQGIVTALVAAYTGYRTVMMGVTAATKAAGAAKAINSGAVAAVKGASSAWETLRLKAMYAGDAVKGVGSKISSAAGAVKNGAVTAGQYAASLGRSALAATRAGLAAAGAATKQALLTTAQVAGNVASKALAIGVRLVNAAMRANPIGIIVTVLTLLVGAVILAYKKSSTFRAIVDGAFRAVGAAASWLWGKIKQAFAFIAKIFLNFTPLGILIKNWNKVKAAAGVVWNWIVSKIQGAARGIIAGIGWLATLPGKVAGWFGRLKDAAVQKATALVSWVKGLPGRILSGLGNLGRLLFNAGKNVIQGLIDGIKNMVGKVKDAIGGVVSTIRDHLPFSPAKIGPLSGAGSPDRAGRKIGGMVAEGIRASLADINTAADLLAATAAPDLSAVSPVGQGGLGQGPEVLELHLDLGHGIREVVQINLREHDRQLKRRVLAGAGVG